jgi:dihydrofolate synthase/folylpolyglutamate synthase
VTIAALDRVVAALDGRASERASVLGSPTLDRIVELLHLLGDPERAYRCVHVGGTNGKTSTSRMTDALLRATGLRTGRYTSPHLEAVTERIAIDGDPLDPDRFAQVYDEVAPYAVLVDAAHERRVSYFELLTAMGFAAFADAPVDVAVVEVGLGGRWDATNVVHAPVTVITPIGLDHTDVLGDTVAAIAREKAGIVHDGATLISADQPPAAASVLAERVAEVGGRLLSCGREFAVADRRLAVGGQTFTVRTPAGEYPDLHLPLYGRHQAGNAACALAAAEAFLGGGRLDPELVRSAFAGVDSPGRLEVVRRRPTVLLDAAHNPAGAAALADALAESFAFDRLHAVVAVLADKDAAGLLAALEPLVSDVTVTVSASARALPVPALAAAARLVLGPQRVRTAGDLATAIGQAVDRAAAEPRAGVLVTGSVLTVGQARELLRAG